MSTDPPPENDNCMLPKHTGRSISRLFSNSRLTRIWQACALCEVQSRGAICVDCDTALIRPQAEQSCPSCARPSARGQLCGACLSEPPHFDRAIAAFAYRFPLDRLIQAFKFRADLTLTDFFVQAMVSSTRANPATLLPDLLVAIPIANQRLAERGFNQAALLADGIGQTMNIEVAHRAVLKVRETPPQSGLSREARKQNIRGAFACSSPLNGKRVAVIDDVMTTGATVSEAAKVLKRAGAEHVEVWVLARTLAND
jgi:ComF family protein